MRARRTAALFAALLPLQLLAPGCHAVTAAPPPHPPAPEMQLALGGFQSDLQPARHADRLDHEYVLPSDETMRYFIGKGIRTFRLPMLWERMQPRLGEPLDKGKLDELDAFLRRADTVGAHVILDLHAFGRYRGQPLGTRAVPMDSLGDFWRQMAERFKGRTVGYDIMNEPHDMPSKTVWPQAAQIAVNAIRKVDKTTPIYVEGDDWANAERWTASNEDLAIRDPADRIVYSAHQYFDKDTSGQYLLRYDPDGATPDIGARRLKPFTDWLRRHGRKGHIGEYAVPGDDPRWLTVMDRFLDAVRANGDVLNGASYWMAGDWADQYPLTLQPVKDGKWTDRPQLRIVAKARP